MAGPPPLLPNHLGTCRKELGAGTPRGALDPCCPRVWSAVWCPGQGVGSSPGTLGQRPASSPGQGARAATGNPTVGMWVRGQVPGEEGVCLPAVWWGRLHGCVRKGCGLLWVGGSVRGPPWSQGPRSEPRATEPDTPPSRLHSQRPKRGPNRDISTRPAQLRPPSLPSPWDWGLCNRPVMVGVGGRQAMEMGAGS